MRQLKIGISSVRGVVGEALTPELIVNFACAFGSWCGNGRLVVIGRDTRGSSAMLRAGVVAGLLATGCEVVDLGLTSTPLISFAVRELGADGGLSITGSHNDAEWNALKFLGPDGALLNPVRSEELLDVYHASQFRFAGWRDLRQVNGSALGTPGAAVLARYLDHLTASLDVEAIRARRPKVAIDFCNGPLHAIAQPFLHTLGCELVPLNAEPSGHFAHPPAPAPENLTELGAITAAAGADLGAGVNVDGDRIAFCTAAGAALSEEFALPLAAAARLRRRPGMVVTNLSSSGMVDVVASAAGQKVLRVPVGESQVLDRGLAEAAVLAGEGSGGVAVLPASATFDALLTLGLVLEDMAVRAASLADLVARLPRLYMRKRAGPCAPDVVHKVVESVRRHYADRNPDCRDGVRVTSPDGWLHARASNTEPLVRVIAEASSDAACAALLDDAVTPILAIAEGA